MPNLLTPAILSALNHVAAHHLAGESERARERERESVCATRDLLVTTARESTSRQGNKGRPAHTLDATYFRRPLRNPTVAASRLRQGRTKKGDRLRAAPCAHIRRKGARTEKAQRPTVASRCCFCHHRRRDLYTPSFPAVDSSWLSKHLRNAKSKLRRGNNRSPRIYRRNSCLNAPSHLEGHLGHTESPDRKKKHA